MSLTRIIILQYIFCPLLHREAYGRIFHLCNLMLYVAFLCFLTSFVCWSASLPGFLSIHRNSSCGRYDELDFQDPKMVRAQVKIAPVVFSSTLIPLGTVYTPDSILGSIIKHVYYSDILGQTRLPAQSWCYERS